MTIDANSHSVRKRIVDLALARLRGQADVPVPAILGALKVSKNRSVPFGPGDLPHIAVYFLHDQPKPVGGDARRPVRLSKSLLVEVRSIVRGDDDSADPYTQWVNERIVSLDRCIDAGGNQLALGVLESETLFEPLEGAQGETCVVRQRFIVDYTTARTDITQVS